MRGLVLLAVLLPLAASAQRGRPIAERGDVALVAEISRSDGLGLLPVLGGLGVRYRLTDRSVIGTSVGVRYTTADRDGDESTSQRYSVALWNENHVGSGRGVVSPFVGAGVRLAVTDDDYRTGTVFDPPGPVPVASSTTSLAVGAGALVGAEVRLARGVTLGAAFMLGVDVTKADRTVRFSDGTEDADRAPTVVSFGTNVSELVLSVYF